jgi:hypothetical protein
MPGARVFGVLFENEVAHLDAFIADVDANTSSGRVRDELRDLGLTLAAKRASEVVTGRVLVILTRTDSP